MMVSEGIRGNVAGSSRRWGDSEGLEGRREDM